MNYRRRVLLDRYAIKDSTRKLKAGDLVVASVMRTFDKEARTVESREIGHVVSCSGTDPETYDVQLDDEVIEAVERSRLEYVVEPTYEDVCQRVASAAAGEDSKFERAVYRLMAAEEFIPAGRILAGLGRPEADVTLFNCYVFAISEDSRTGISQHWARLFETFSRGGGIGWNLSILRPKGAVVKKVNGRSSGSVSWAEQFSQITGAVEQGGCFAGDTRIATDVGLLTATELADYWDTGQPVHAVTHRGLQRITAAFRNGDKEVWRVRTKRGYEVLVTPEHKMGVLDNGRIQTKALNELTIGDETLISVTRCTGESTTEPRLEASDYQRSVMSTTLNTDVRLPEAVDSSLAYFVGYMLGNGSTIIGKKVTWQEAKGISLSVPSKRPEVAQLLLECINQSFGLNAETYAGDGACVDIHVYSRVLMEWMKLNGIDKPKADVIRVPEIILRGTPRLQGAFVSGYFDADGCDRGSKGGYGFDSISKAMLQDVQVLLANRGILSRLSTQERPQPNWRDIHRLSVTGIVFKKRMSRFMWMSCKDEENLNGKQDKTNYPIEVFLARKPASRFYAGAVSTVGPRVSYRALGRVMQRLRAGGEHDSAADYRALLNVVPDVIVAVEPVDKQEVFDFEVGDVHMITGNSFYTSNSRRGASLQGLEVWHPDVEEFIAAKALREEFKAPDGQVVSRNRNLLKNSNVSVLITGGFMQAVERDEDWDLVFPRLDDPDYDKLWDGNLEKWRELDKPVDVYKTLRARDLWNQIIERAWEAGEPGIIFLDRCNKMANSYYYDRITCTNPCGEQALSPNSICNLGHLNLAKFVKPDDQFPADERTATNAGKRVDWKRLKVAIQTGVQFLDTVTDRNKYHDEAVRKQQAKERRIGLGLLGYGEMLLRLGLRYGSPEALKFTSRLMRCFSAESYLASAKLAKQHGSFSTFDADLFLHSGFMRRHTKAVREAVRRDGMRNVTVNTIAPTGSVAAIMQTSSGCEPFFELEYTSTTRIGVVTERPPVGEELIAKFGLDRSQWPSYVVTAQKGITPAEHVATQGMMQRWIDSSIAKTVNLPGSATVEDVAEAYQEMWKLGCKGGTVYRDGSRDEQVLYADTDEVEVEVEIVDETPETRIVRPRPDVGHSLTFSEDSPIGTVHMTIRHEPEFGDPMDVFVTVGKGDTAADAEAIGRLMSLILQFPNGQHINQNTRLELIRDQLMGILGRGQVGFGADAKHSMPDTIAKILDRYLSAEFPMANIPFGLRQMRDLLEEVKGYGGNTEKIDQVIRYVLEGKDNGGAEKQQTYQEEREQEIQEAESKGVKLPHDYCPECGNYTLVTIPGQCPHCRDPRCAYTRC